MKTKWFHWIWVVLIAAGCARAEPTAAPVVQQPARAAEALALAGAFEKAECPPSRFGGSASGTQQSMECGFLNVPVDRSQPEGEKIRIAVTIIRASAEKTQPDPVVFVAYTGSTGFAFAYRNILLDRDLIMVDPRGVGRSEPALTCPAVLEVAAQNTALPPYDEEVTNQVLAEQQACYQEWQAQGADLSQYTSAAIAADLEDLRQALGYELWNVYASGYGARAALIMMRDYPQTVRSVVLESPPAMDGEDLAGVGANLDRVLNLFFDSCAADRDCNEAFPELKTVFYEVVNQLNGEPHSMEISDLNAGRRYQLLLNGDRLIDITVRAVSSGSSMILPEIPRAIYHLKSRNFDVLGRLLGGGMFSNFGFFTSGVQWQVECAELLPQTSRERILQGMGSLDIGLRDYMNRQYAMSFKTCDMLKDVKPALDLQQIAASTIPALILHGDRSTGTSPAWAKRAGSMLSSATVVEITGSGAGGFDRNRGSCSRSIAAAFVADPKSQLDTACAAMQTVIPWITLP